MDKDKFQAAVAFTVPVVLALALAGTCIWSAFRIDKTERRVAALERQAQAGYTQALYQLSDNVNDMQSALKKLQVTGSMAQHVTLLSEVWRLSGAAVANMGLVPDSHTDTAELNEFIVRVGDYANATNKRILSGAVLTGDDYETLSALYEASVRIGNDLSARIEGESFPTRSLDAEAYYGGAAPASAGEGGAEDAEGEGAASKEAVSDYPTLIYDGPFSESNTERTPQGLPQGEIDALAAKRVAIGYLGGGALEDNGTEEGVIPVYGFAGTDASGRNVEITVSKQGGQVLWMMAETQGGADGVPDENTVATMRDAAKRFLDERGYDEMEATYAQFYNGVGVFNFASAQDGVILYADLVKVYVERSSGAVVGADAYNYLMCHTRRELPAPALSEEEAGAFVSGGLEVKSVRLALIPLTASTEKLCYEFKGTCRGADFIVYINAINGAEEQIFEIINSDEGQLVV